MIEPDVIDKVVNYLDKEERQRSPCVPNTNTTNDKELISFYKTVSTGGTKVIRIEIYDANQFESNSMCQCSAEICVQHIVKSIYTDNIYLRIKDMLPYLNNTFYQSL